MMPEAQTSIDPEEVAKFDRLAADWWSPTGSMKPLHQLNPPRLRYIRDRIVERFGAGRSGVRGLEGLAVVDVGCGAGLACEPLARLGADVTGVDAGPTNIEVARLHAARAGLAIDYRETPVESLVAAGERFDVVLSLEVVEHVVEPAAFLRSCGTLVKPGGLMIVSTINRTGKAYALAIVAAERVLRWLPRGTHDWNKFVTPAEIDAAVAGEGLVPIDCTGLVYHPLFDEWQLGRDTDVNYIATYARN